MKYGLLIHRECVNLGDDIQSYAESLFLPKIDYFVDREHINRFKPEKSSDKDQPVATIMGAWWFHRKWNFPPSKYIYPLCISMHITDYTTETTGTPLYDEFVEGIGGDYLRAYGPVGARDMVTKKVLKDKNIPSYFSGCITLTLPKRKMKKISKPYILLVDLDDRVERKIIDSVDETRFEVKVVSNIRSKKRTEEEMDDWEFRKNEAIELLDLYQNASCVITKRLHASLPCLAMEVPVFCVIDRDIRFDPYYDWLHSVSVDDFLTDNYDYDIFSPPKNKDLHIPTRDKLNDTVTEFIKNTTNDKKSVNELVKTSYTDEESTIWRNELMEYTLDKWWTINKKKSKKIQKLLNKNYEMKEQNKSLRRRIKQLDKKVSNKLSIIKDIEASSSWRITKPLRVLNEHAKRIFKDI